MYWQGEGCIIEILEGVRCPKMTEGICPQCTAIDDDLVEVD
jgi:hypothetical protein